MTREVFRMANEDVFNRLRETLESFKIEVKEVQPNFTMRMSLVHNGEEIDCVRKIEFSDQFMFNLGPAAILREIGHGLNWLMAQIRIREDEMAKQQNKKPGGKDA